MTDSEKEYCVVSDNDCEAPAGWGVMGYGCWTNRGPSAKYRCRSCNEKVCGKCSVGRGKKRMCKNCEMEGY